MVAAEFSLHYDQNPNRARGFCASNMMRGALYVACSALLTSASAALAQSQTNSVRKLRRREIVVWCALLPSSMWASRTSVCGLRLM